MRAPLFAAAFAAGAVLLQHQKSLPSSEWAALLLCLAPFLFFRRARPAAVLFLAFGAGFYYSCWRAETRLAEKIPEELEWRDVVAEGIVRGFPDSDSGRTRFDFDIEKLVSPAAALRLRARLYDYHHGKPPPEEIKTGARLRLKIRIRPPRANFNPDGFDYAGLLFASGVRAAGYVRGGEITVLREGGGFRDSLRRGALAQREGGLLAALVVGDRSRISDLEWRVFRRTGTAHLLSISGTHITLAAGGAALAAAFVWRRIRRLTRIMPAQKAALAVAAAAALGYAFLAGFGVPVQRSVLMFFAAAAAVFGGGMTSAASALSFAAFAVIALDPWAVSSPGFWLSFLLAWAVVHAASGGGVLRMLKAQCLVSVFAAPLTLWFFNEASLVSPLANFVAVPLAGLIILPLALSDVLLPFDFLWRLAGWALFGLREFLEALSAAPHAARNAAAPWWVFIPAILGAAWMLAPRGTPLRWAGIFPVLAALAWPASAPVLGNFNMTVLDVGQGAAVVVETKNKTLIYDAGPRHGFFTVDNFLRRAGNRRGDVLIASHDDFDHAGGAEMLLLARRPDLFMAPEPPPPRLLRAAKNYAPCKAGEEWEWDGVRFRFLHPPEGAKGLSDNASSCVLKISAAGGSALLAGDIPEEIERELAARWGAKLRADVLLAAHHGSRHSTSAEFVGAVSPDFAVFSAGAGNRFGHPHPDALRRASAGGAAVFRTDTDGAVQFMFGENKTEIIKWRGRGLRYWHEK